MKNNEIKIREMMRGSDTSANEMSEIMNKPDVPVVRMNDFYILKSQTWRNVRKVTILSMKRMKSLRNVRKYMIPIMKCIKRVEK
jgi:hypothetical protein